MQGVHGGSRRRDGLLCRPLTAPEQHLQGQLPPVLPILRSPPRAVKFGAIPCAAGTCGSSARRSAFRAAIGKCNSIRRSRATRDRILIDGVEVERGPRPNSRNRDGPRDHDGRPAAVRPRNRRTGRGRIVRESAAFRRLRRDGPHHLRYRASGQASDADAGRVSDPRHRKISRSIRRPSTRWWWWATPPCAISSSGRACTRLGRTPTGRSPKSRWPRASGPRPASPRPAVGACCPSIPKPASTARPSSAGTSAPTPQPACWPSIWRTRSAWSRSWISAPIPS